MEIRSFYIIGLLLFLGLLNGCSSDEELPVPANDAGYDFFPLAIGNTWIYQVDSTVFDPQSSGIAKIKSSVQLKWVVKDTLTDQSGELGYRIEQYQRKSDTLPWNFWRNIFVVKRSSRLEWLENNLRFIKMIFPPDEGLTWDGNAFVDDALYIEIAGEPIQIFKSWDYKVLEIKSNDSVNNQLFSSVLHLQLADDENLIEQRKGFEKYAKGVGLIYRSLQILDTQQLDPTIEWEEKAEKGFIVTISLLEYF